MPNQQNSEEHAHSRSRRALRSVRSHVQPGSFWMLLVAALVSYVLNGLAIESTAGETLLLLGRIGVACAGLYVLSANRVTLRLGVIVIVLVIIFEFRMFGFDPRINLILRDSVTGGFLVWILFVVLREVFRPTTGEQDAVIGALCGFMIIVTLFLRLHGLLEALVPGSYHTDGPPLSERSVASLIAIFQYFSTITLTTVGFGDIVPVTPAARLVTGLEAVVGQLYLAVVIATLVGRAASRRG